MSQYSQPLTPANVATYSPAFACNGSRAVQLTIVNQACVAQFGRGIGGIVWGDDDYRLPGVHTIPGPIDAVRVKQHSPTPAGGKPGQFAIAAFA